MSPPPRLAAAGIACLVGACTSRAEPPSPTPVESTAAATTAFSLGSSSASSAALSVASVASAVAPTPPRVSTTHLISWIYDQPRFDAAHAGYLRAGWFSPYRPLADSDPRAAKRDKACAPWLELSPSGFVCDGRDGVTTKLDEPAIVVARRYLAKTDAPLPYGFGTSYGSPLYARIPTPAEQRDREGDVAASMKQRDDERAKLGDKAPPRTAMPIESVPDFLLDRGVPGSVVGWPVPKSAVTAGAAWPGMRLSLLTAFESEGRPFYLTTEHFIVPADRMRAARLADFHGVALAAPEREGAHLPMAWVRWRPAQLFALEPAGPTDSIGATSATPTGETLPFQWGGSIEPRERVLNGVRYLVLTEAPSGLHAPSAGAAPARYAIRANEVTRLDAATQRPYDVGDDDAWIEISIARQTLTLYRGLRPVFATLVSTGADGAGDVETTRSTPRGQFRIYSKHVGYRMSADEHPPWTEGGTPDPHYRIDDVPYVQYFQGGYALHAAFWHDSFGQPKSHGCVNLSPRDALYLFGQTEPKLPDGWYGAYSGRGGLEKGTVIVIRAY